MVVAIAVLGALTFLAVVKVLQPTQLARRADGLDDAELQQAAAFLRRREPFLAPSAVGVCLVASGSSFVSVDAAWPLWAAAAGAAVALGAASRGAVQRVEALLRARRVPLDERRRHLWLDLTTVLFAATWCVRELATHPPLQQLELAQVVLLPAVTVSAGVAAWHALRAGDGADLR